MAIHDLQNFRWFRTGANVQRTLPVVKLEALVVATGTMNVLRDFTGANALDLWQQLGTLTTAEQDEIIDAMINRLLDIKRRGV